MMFSVWQDFPLGFSRWEGNPVSLRRPSFSVLTELWLFMTANCIALPSAFTVVHHLSLWCLVFFPLLFHPLALSGPLLQLCGKRLQHVGFSRMKISPKEKMVRATSASSTGYWGINQISKSGRVSIFMQCLRFCTERVYSLDLLLSHAYAATSICSFNMSLIKSSWWWCPQSQPVQWLQRTWLTKGHLLLC